MARDQKIYETNNYGGGVLVDRTTELPVGFTAQGVDQYMVIPVADPLTGGITYSPAETAGNSAYVPRSQASTAPDGVVLRTVEAARGTVYREAINRGSSTHGATTKENTTWGFGFNMLQNYTKEVLTEPMLRIGLEGGWLNPGTGITTSEFHVEYADPALGANETGIRPISIAIETGGDGGLGSPSMRFTVSESQPYSGLAVKTPSDESVLEFGSSGWNFFRNLTIHRGAGAASYIALGDHLNSATLALDAEATTGVNTISFGRGGVSSWLLYDAASATELYLYDATNNRIHIRYLKGSTSETAYTDFYSRMRVYGQENDFGPTTNCVRIGSLGTGDVWIDAMGGSTNTNVGLNLRAKGTGRIVSQSSHSFQSTVGFNGTTPPAKPTVTGAKGSNAALASLLTALASTGLLTDSSTA